MDRYKRISDYRAPDPKVRVGGEIESWCTKCRRVLDHTILAMELEAPKRVMCITCKSQHNYRSGKPSTAKRASTARSTPSKAKTSGTRTDRDWQDAVGDKNISRPIPYNPHQSFEADQVIMHGKFGTGIIIEVKPGNKITVVFQDATRILVHNR